MASLFLLLSHLNLKNKNYELFFFFFSKKSFPSCIDAEERNGLPKHVCDIKLILSLLQKLNFHLNLEAKQEAAGVGEDI